MSRPPPIAITLGNPIYFPQRDVPPTPCYHCGQTIMGTGYRVSYICMVDAVHTGVGFELGYNRFPLCSGCIDPERTFFTL